MKRPCSYCLKDSEEKVTKDIKLFLLNNDIDIQAAQASIFNISICYSAYTDSDGLYGNSLKNTFFHTKNGYFTQMQALENLKKITKIYYDDYLIAGGKIDKFIKEQDLIIRKLESLGKKDFLKIIECSQSWWKYALMGEDKGRCCEDDIKNIFIKKGCQDNEIGHLVSVLAVPKNPSVFIEERVAFYKLCINFLNKKPIENGAIKYIKTFFYIDTVFYDRKIISPTSLENKIKAEVRGRDENFFKTKIKKIKNDNLIIRNEKKAIFNRFNFNEEEKKKIEFLEVFSDWLNIRKVNMMKTFYFLANLLHIISASKKIPYNILAAYTFQELTDLILHNSQVPLDTIRNRKNGCFVEVRKGEIIFIYGDEADNLLNLARGVINHDLIRGNVAFRGGLIRGVAQIIKDPAFDEFTKGNILVTSMTRIEFVPLMKRAKAIITDEGGISCHAAIVSRELGVPCIVGTKVATQVLKSGDEIEVDTDNGLVRVLKKKK